MTKRTPKNIIWTPEKVAHLRELAPTTPPDELVKILERPISSIRNAASLHRITLMRRNKGSEYFYPGVCKPLLNFDELDTLAFCRPWKTTGAQQ